MNFFAEHAGILNFSVVDPHQSDSTDHPNADQDADPDSDFYLMLIRMRLRIRLFTLMRTRTRIQILVSNKKAQTLAKSVRIPYGTFWHLICKLMRTRVWFRIQLITLMLIRIFLFDADKVRMRIQFT
jgi:hypothetical protein